MKRMKLSSSGNVVVDMEPIERVRRIFQDINRKVEEEHLLWEQLDTTLEESAERLRKLLPEDARFLRMSSNPFGVVFSLDGSTGQFIVYCQPRKVGVRQIR